MPLAPPAPDCLIVGGGIIGLSIAWELNQRGCQCLVVDQHQIGSGSSWAAAGILPPARWDTARDPVDQLRGRSHALFPQWHERLLATSGIDSGYRRCGGIYLARHVGEAALLQGLARYWSEYEIDSQSLSSSELARLEPELSSLTDSQQLRSALLAPDEAQVRPPRLLAALRQSLVNSGTKFLAPLEIKAISLQDNQVRSVQGIDSQGILQEWTPGQLILCCGAWAGRFADPRGRVGNVFPVRGQVILYQAAPGMLKRVINEGNRYFVPRDDGLIYVGSHEEEVGFVQQDNPAVIEELQTWAAEIVPAAVNWPVVRTWCGLRPGSFDGFPYIGRSPEAKNMYLATGHFRSGIHLSCGTAEVIADLVEGKTPSIDCTPFRFPR